MSDRWFSGLWLSAIYLLATFTSTLCAQTQPAAASSGEAVANSPPQARASTEPSYAPLLREAKTYSGLFTIYQKGNSLFIELASGNYGQDYIVLVSIARGIGFPPILGGLSLSFGDDWIWQFRKVDDRVHVVRKNVRFRANRGSPEHVALQSAYTDSVLFGLRTIGKGPKGGDLVDFTPVFMSDLPQLGRMLPGTGFSPDRSGWASIKAFEKNVELEVAATYASSGLLDLETVPDSRGMTVNIHYSISALPSTGYVPRLADDRVGYLLTVVKDISRESDRDQFVRYVNRWHLERPPGAREAPYAPKEPIVFWIEKTVPHRYRKVVREGIEEWNKALEKAGWLNAIEVRQQPDDATWDPEDINYNTFRWIASNVDFSMEMSRVNPYTGQILDADIIFPATFLQFWKEEFTTVSPASTASASGDSPDPLGAISPRKMVNDGLPRHICQLSHGMSHQLAFGSAAILTRAAAGSTTALQEKMIMQGLKETVMHEMGHALGLRHNFKGSRYLSVRDANDPTKTRETGMVASIMDYTPANLVPKDWQQGDFYPTTLGPYDYWAVEYGYKPLSGGTEGEVAELKKIAARSGERALQFATDEDTDITDADPDSNRFDFGNDPIEFARVRAEVVREALPGLVERMTKDGEDYSQVRRALNILLAQHGEGMFFAARNVGGLVTSRSHKGDKDAAPPFTLVPAEKQRAALALLEQHVFSDKAYPIPSDLYKYLATPNWQHWGVRETRRQDYPVHGMVAMWQNRILDQLMSSTTLERMHDSEFKAAANEDVLTAAELLHRLSKAVFSELETIKEGEFTDRKPAISSLRRNLQRELSRRLANLSLGRTAAPDDCQSVAYAELASLEAQMRNLLKSKVSLDGYSRAHLEEAADRISKVRDARVTIVNP